MKYALNIDADGRILSATYPQYAPADAVTVAELPEGDLHEYRYVDGEYIHDPLHEEPEAPETAATTDEVLNALLGV